MHCHTPPKEERMAASRSHDYTNTEAHSLQRYAMCQILVCCSLLMFWMDPNDVAYPCRTSHVCWSVVDVMTWRCHFICHMLTRGCEVDLGAYAVATWHVSCHVSPSCHVSAARWLLSTRLTVAGWSTSPQRIKNYHVASFFCGLCKKNSLPRLAHPLVACFYCNQCCFATCALHLFNTEKSKPPHCPQ